MSIVQISKIKQRTGALVDLPQLDEGELGWAADARRLFIGKSTPNENVEVLTGYSSIDYGQINGSVGNLNMVNPVNGQTLAYVASSNTWVNAGGNASDPGNAAYFSSALLHLGNISQLKIGGGGIGYVMETDGAGNLAWSPKGTITARISNATKANPVVITTTAENAFVNKMVVTISDVVGMTQLNGNSYYVAVLTATTFALYSDAALTTPVDGTAYTTYVSGGRVLGSVGSSTGTGGAAGGSTNSVQYNNGGVSTGDSNLAWLAGSRLLSVTGDANVSGNITANIINSATANIANVFATNITGTLVTTNQPNITNVGTLGNLTVTNNVSGSVLTATTTSAAPLVINSTTRVANLNVAYANVADFTRVATANANSGVMFLFGGTSVSGNVASLGISTVQYDPASTYLSVPKVSANAFITSTANGAVSISPDTGGNISLGLQSTASSTPHIDFHTSATVVDYNVRISASGNTATIGSGTLTITADNTAFSGNVVTTSITSGANTTVGTITGNWGLSAGSKLTATYADLAEYYEADQDYDPGTVLMIGGEKEVTMATYATNKIIGVVTTNPAYVMNSLCPGTAVAIALQGRVPVKVSGKVAKGDMLVSAGFGLAKASSNPSIGMVIGKALETFDGETGVIEAAVGRL